VDGHVRVRLAEGSYGRVGHGRSRDPQALEVRQFPLARGRLFGFARSTPMTALTLRFGTPVHGWLDAELIGPRGRSFVDASDCPGDSLAMLASAMCGLLLGRDETHVTWFLEPAETTWSFRRTGDQVRVLVAETSAQQRRIATASVAEVALPIWRGLRTLEDDPAWARADAADTAWSTPFPHADVARLGELLAAPRA
jgi:hypothetical protein